MRNHSAALLLVAFTAVPAAASPPPVPYVDRGACPFECCVYRGWTTLRTTLLREAPEAAARVVGSTGPGEAVAALTGQVVTSRPGRFRVLRETVGADGEHYRPGETVFVYTNLGEGFLRVWHGGAMHDEEVPFMLDDAVTGGVACPAETRGCWGRREARPESVWWVEVRTPAGLTGWTDQPENFANQDACG